MIQKILLIYELSEFSLITYVKWTLQNFNVLIYLLSVNHYGNNYDKSEVQWSK